MDQTANNNIKTNKYQHNDAIYNDLTFDTNSFNLSNGTKDPLPVVSVSLRGGKKHISMNVSGITCLWDSEATNIMINRRHTKYYECKMQYNKVEYSTAAGVYCTTHDVKVTFCMPYFSSSKIINHQFHVDNDKGYLGIGYDMIIGSNLMEN